MCFVPLKSNTKFFIYRKIAARPNLFPQYILYTTNGLDVWRAIITQSFTFKIIYNLNSEVTCSISGLNRMLAIQNIVHCRGHRWGILMSHVNFKKCSNVACCCHLGIPMTPAKSKKCPCHPVAKAYYNHHNYLGPVVSLKPIFHCDAKKLRWALALAQPPKATILRWGYQHVGI